MKRFKSKKKHANGIIYLGFFLISIALSSKFLYDHNLINNDTLISFLISDNLGSYQNDISDVDFLLKYAFNIDTSQSIPVMKEENNSGNKSEVNSDKIFNEPILYIYNTHQEEKYQSNLLEPYNISAGVFVASKMLKEYLESEGIPTIVEENNIADALHALNLKYGSSYKISRSFMESAKEKNPSLKYYIDLHRDSSIYDKTTTTINDEKYARLLFVVGLDHDNYEPNLNLATKLRSKIDTYDNTLCRGIMKKSGKGVNGIYNQDFSEYAMLIEVGGQYNNISEVNNTLKVLAKILADFIREEENG